MSIINIEETSKTPKIIANAALGTLSIKGKSYPENTRVFYEPLVKWLVDFSTAHPKVITVDLEIEYYNTSTSSILFKILDALKKISASSEMTITWHYAKDDIEMEEIGQDFQNILGDILTLNPVENHKNIEQA